MAGLAPGPAYHAPVPALSNPLRGALPLLLCAVCPGQIFLLHNGKIWTGDRRIPQAEALIVSAGRITALGSSAALGQRCGPGAFRIDLRGRRVLPGLIDAHVHFLGGGDELLAPDLRSARSEEEFARRLGAAAAELPKGTWLTSGSWDHENWPGGQLPTAAVIDKHVPDHPVFVYRLDGHMAVANSAAMRRARIRKETPAPAGGVIVRDAAGNPAGVFKDTAMILITRHIPRASDQVLGRRMRAALQHAASLGITGVHDMLDSLRPLRSYQELARRQALTCRVSIYAPVSSRARWAALGLRQGWGAGTLRVHGFKAFADGSLGSTTAWFFDPYTDTPASSGLPMPAMLDGGRMPEDVSGATAAGMQLAIHAIGDRANAAILDLYAAQGAALSGLRPRIEHAQHLRRADLARFSELGVIASMQPYHAIDDGRWAEKRIGAERIQTTYAFRALLDAGATLAFGSDWPVAPLSPWLGLYAAVTRRTLDGAHPEGWVPAQKISVEEALRAYTMGSARAGFADAEVGSLYMGKRADLIVLDRDPFHLDPARLKDVQVDLTMMDGRIVHERAPAAAAALRPAIIRRREWGAETADFRRMRPQRVRRITIHHSGVDLAGWPAVDGAERTRNLQRWSLRQRPWGDLPYHYCIAPDGKIYAGRDHHYAGDTNTGYDPSGHLLIEVMGDLSRRQPTAAQLGSLDRLCAWACRRFGARAEKIAGHSAFAETSCPGLHLRRRIESGALAAAVQALLQR